MKPHYYFLFIILFVLIGCKEYANHTDTTVSNWKLMYRNDASGKTLFGNKKELINAVRKGYPIKIGFGSRRLNDNTKSVEHLTDVHFLTILNEKEVFGQIQPIIGQNPELESDTLNITFRPNLEWTIMVGTNGFSDRLTTDRINDSIVGHRSRPINVSWFVHFPATKDTIFKKANPLW